MFCEECDNSEATFHLTEISDENQSELHLCMNCIKNMSGNTSLYDHPLSLSAMLSFLNDKSAEDETACTCPECGMTGIELSWHGRPGCPGCYKHFSTILSKLIIKDRFMDKYSGKKPVNYVEVMSASDSSPEKYIESVAVDKLEEELRKAVLEERYEDAAMLRDRIKEVNAIE